MNLAELNKIAVAMVAPGKGILAADESSGTIKKRFDAIKVDSTENSRRDYREMLFRSREAMSKYISGVILYDETIWQDAKDGTPLVKLIEQAGSIPGIKVDEGTQALPNCPGELVTAGPRRLRPRALDPGLDEIDHPLSEGGEFVLAFDRECAVLPGVADLVEHRRDHADENVDRPAMGGDGVLDQRPGCVEIAPAPGGKQRLENVPQRDCVGVFIAAEQIRLLARAFPAQPVRDAEIRVRRHLANELLAMGTPFQHAATPLPRFPQPSAASLPTKAIAARRKR